MKTYTYDDVWMGLEKAAKAEGANDKDLETMRSKVKSFLVDCDWVTPDGEVTVVSVRDKAAMIKAASDQVQRLLPAVVGTRLAASIQANVGFAPTKGQVVAGSTTFSSLLREASSNNNLPMLASVGDRCPKCSSSMKVVRLVNDKAGLFCTSDRVVLPLATTSVSS